MNLTDVNYGLILNIASTETIRPIDQVNYELYRKYPNIQASIGNAIKNSKSMNWDNVENVEPYDLLGQTLNLWIVPKKLMCFNLFCRRNEDIDYDVFGNCLEKLKHASPGFAIGFEDKDYPVYIGNHLADANKIKSIISEKWPKVEFING